MNPYEAPKVDEPAPPGKPTTNEPLLSRRTELLLFFGLNALIVLAGQAVLMWKHYCSTYEFPVPQRTLGNP